MKDTVTNKDLYTEIMKVHTKIDEVVDNRITPLERTVDRLWVYAGIAGLISSTILTGAISWIREKIKI